jgi:pyruvate dehydrogenase E2 component (dihydrolipoamide acetyltransferase)
MAEEVKMPQMGESIAEGTIVRWLKQVGDAVKRDEPLFEISTDKVDAEIPSPTSGTLLEIKAKEGETVAVNSVVAVIGSGDTKAAPAADAKPEPVAPTTPAEQPAAATSAPEPAPAPQTAAPPASAQTAEDSRQVKSSPVVRKIAEEHGVDISRIQGTGVDGRVTKQDILKFIEEGGAQPAAAASSQAAAPAQAPAPSTQAAAPASAPAAPASAPTAPVSKPAAAQAQPFADGDRVEIEPMSIMRRKISERMVESKHTSAHVYSLIEVDYSKTSALRDKLKGEYLQRDGVKLTFLPFIIKAVIEGLKKFPIINSSVWGDQIVYKKEYNIGVAVALDWGLIVPVVRNADEKSLLGLAKAVNDLGERARGKKLKPDEVQGGTFTITNPGVYGGLIGLPIINQPQVAILGVGGIKKRPVVVEDAIAIRQIGLLSLSYDHRVVDGAQADQFLAFVRDLVEAAEFTS